MRQLCSFFVVLILFQLSGFQSVMADDNWLRGDRARLQTLDKITARISTLDVPIGLTTRFGTLELYVHSCNYRPPDHPPDLEPHRSIALRTNLPVEDRPRLPRPALRVHPQAPHQQRARQNHILQYFGTHQRRDFPPVAAVARLFFERY